MSATVWCSKKWLGSVLVACCTSCILLPIDDVVESEPADTEEGDETEQSDETEAPDPTDGETTDEGETATDAMEATDTPTDATDESTDATDEPTDPEPDTPTDVDGTDEPDSPTDPVAETDTPTDVMETDEPDEPVCGDGACEGSEDHASCCDDCGCIDDHTCEDNECVPPCEETTLLLTNALPNVTTYSELCAADANTPSAAYVGTVAGEIAAEGSLPVPLAYGESLNVAWACCLVDYDGCFTNNNATCYFEGNYYYCTCLTFEETFTATTCGEQVEVICE